MSISRHDLIDRYAADMLPDYCCSEVFRASAIEMVESGSPIMQAIDAALLASDHRQTPSIWRRIINRLTLGTAYCI
jgi:hypothetical protein